MWKRMAYQLIIGLFLASICAYVIGDHTSIISTIHIMCALALMMSEIFINFKERWSSGLMMSFTASLILLIMTKSCYYTLLILLTGISLGYIGEYIRQHVQPYQFQRGIILGLFAVLIGIDLFGFKGWGQSASEFDFSIQVVYPFIIAIGLFILEFLKRPIKSYYQK